MELGQAIADLEDTIFIADGGEDVRLETEVGMKEADIARKIYGVVKTLRAFQKESVLSIQR